MKILLILLLFSLQSYGQKKCIDISTYDSMLVYIAEGTQAIIDAQTYKKSDSVKMVEINRKEQVIVNQRKLKYDCLALVDSLQAQGKLKDDLLLIRKETIDKMSKPKKFAIGFQVGYGYGFSNVVKLQPYVGVGVQYTFLRF